MYNHNKAQQSKNRVHISWDILYVKETDLDIRSLQNFRRDVYQLTSCVVLTIHTRDGVILPNNGIFRI